MATFEELRKRAKSGDSSATSSGTSFDDLRARAKQEKFDEDVGRVDDSYITLFLDTADSYLSSAEKDYGEVGFSNAYQSYLNRRDRLEDLEYRRDVISKYLENNRDSLDEDSYNGLSDTLSRFGTDASNILEAFSGAKDYYSQWDTEEEYLSFVDWDEKRKFDLGKGQEEISALEKQQEDIRRSRQKGVSSYLTGDSSMQSSPYAASQQGGGVDQELKALADEISQKKQYLNQARYIQDGVALSGVSDPNSEHYDPNFGKMSGADESVTDAKYRWINDEQYRSDALDYSLQATTTDLPESVGRQEQAQAWLEANGNPAATALAAANLNLMTEDEVAIYNYHYAKDGPEAADKYLHSIQETLNYRKATGMFSKMEDKTALELAFGVAAGFDQFTSGMMSFGNTEDDYIVQTATQMASGMVREDLKTVGPKLPQWLGGASLGQAAYDATTTMSNMAPSILSSAVANALLPGSGAVVGNSMMFASSAGNAYQEALNLGYDKSQARAYSTLVGASEAGLQYLLGGIGSLGGKVSGGAITKMLDGIDNAFFRTAGKLGGNMLSEGLEEGLQEILTPMFKELALRADEDINWSEVAYSALLGALTAGVMEGPSTISGEVSTYQTGKQLQEGGITAQRLSEIGSTFAADTVAYQLAGRVDENTGAYTMGRLFNEIGATLTEQNVNDITQALVQKGMSENMAKQNARAMAVVVEGGNLSDAQVKIIEANDVLAEAVRTTIIDSNATWFQRTKGYNEALMALAQEKTAPKATVAEQVLPGQENADATDIVDAEAEVGSEADYEAPKVQSISSIEKGVATIKLEDGSEVSVREAGLDPDDGVRIEAIASIEGISTEDANYILGTLRAAPGATAQMDSLGAKEAYKYGYYGFSQEHIAKHGVFANSLSESQRQAIYETGRAARQRQVEKATPKTATVAKNATTGKVHFDGDRSTLTERQSASLTAMEKVADALGVQIYVFESKLKNGKRIGANGWYDTKDGSIHIDLHAGAKGEGTMMFTLAHELTHHIRQWSPAKFKALADFLMQEYGKKGVNVDGLVREQMAKAKRGGRTISYDTAYEEVVADSMETMLSDGKIVEKLAKLKAKDKSLWNKIKKFIHKLAAKIRSVYEGLAPDSVEGRYVAEMVDSIEKLQELFTEGLVDASKNYQASLTPGKEGVVANQKGEAVAYSTEDGSVLLSMRTYEEDGREALRDYLTKCVSSKKLTQTEMDEMLSGIEEIYQVCKEFKDKYAPFSSWSDAAVVRNTRGKPVFSVVTPNGDYKMNLDFSLVCKKRRTLDAVFNEMSRRGIIDDFELGQKSVVKINEIIRKYGLETACALCFVDAKRFRQASMADSFVSLYNELVESLVPEDQKGSIDHFNFSGYDTIQKVDGGIDTWDSSKLDFSHINHVLKTYGNGTVEYKAAKYIKSNPKGRKLLLRGDFMSSQGFDAVKTRNQDILKLYNSKKGTGGPKAAFGDVQYLNEVIQKARWWTPAKAYAVGGVRVQSFSDYVPRMVFDYVQMVYDLAATKLPAHAYTKEAQFVKQFGLTGIKINMSLIPAIAEGGVAPGLDANGNYVWAGESFDFETAKEIQNAEGYTENCGTICVGVSDRHIRKLLSDPDIRMVIPYHKSGLNPIVAHMNKIAEFTDYTNDQNTTVKETGGKAEKHFDFNKALHDMGENADPRAVIQQYFDWCDDNGYVPKFAAFRDHPNYYKLIEDFTLFDKDGRYVPQHEVRAVFPKTDSAFGSMKKLIEEGLQEDAIVEGKRDARLNAIVDEIQATLPKTEAEIEETQVEQADRDLEALKLSDRDSDGNALTKEQSAFFAQSRVRDANGNLLKVYHGTPRGGFTVFNEALIGATSDYGYLGRGFYFTAKERTAKYYAGYLNSSEVKSGYLNIKNPYIIPSKRDIAFTLESIMGHRFDGEDADYERSVAFTKWLKDNGYDGVICRDEIMALRSNQFKNADNTNPTADPDIRYSERDNAPTFYSHMARVVDGVKQEKLGAASVVSMLRGKGVKAEEIKWSGIEEWLAGKKSVTKAELQEFIAGSMLQIEEDILDNKDRPYTEDQKQRLSEYKAKQDEATKRVADEWKKTVGTDLPVSIRNVASESGVVNAIIDANKEHKDASFEGRLLKKLGKDLRKVIEKNDDFGFDSVDDALRSIYRHRRDFINFYEMSSHDKAVIVKYCNALNAYNELPNMVSDEDADRLRAIAREANPWGRKISEVMREHDKDQEKFMTKWERYKLRGGKNYREMLFRIPESTYTNEAMMTHWQERKGVLAHARVQDLDTFLGNMLFIEEIQSDWHNEGHKTGYQDVPDAPFSDNYHEYVLKRLLREAAEQGYDSIGWTTAETQDERWANNRPHKEGEGKSGFLKGYRIEYDQDIPKFLNKYGKKWGTRVGKTVLDSGTEVWSMAITDEMKDSVLTEGQPLYSDRDTFARAKEHFGTTTDFEEAGFILPGGEMLKFTDDKHRGERLYDHRAIGIAYGVKVDLNVNHGFNHESNKHLDDFVEKGGIRFDPGSFDLDMDAGMQLSKSIPLTAAQEQTIREFIEWKHQREEMYQHEDDDFSLYGGPLALHIEFGGDANYAVSASAKDLDAWGVKHLSYEGGQVNASRIIADIRHYYRTGETRKPSVVAQFRYSDRDSDSVSNRSLLANAFEGVAQNDIEKQKIQEYKGKISLIESEERKLGDLTQKIKDLSFAKGPKDTKTIRDLQFEAKQTANRISTYDKQLLRLEASKPLQDVLTREKKMAYQRAEKKGKDALAAYREKATRTQRALMDRYQDARKRNVEGREKTAMRHKIQNVVKELNDLLLNESKKRHVPDNLKKAVADALALVNMDTVGAEERAAKYANLIAKETDPDKITAYTVTMENILAQGEKIGQRLKDLRDAYEEIQESDDPDISGAYDPVIAGALKELAGSIGNTSIRNMSIEQLSDVYDMYKMVLTKVRDANKSFLNAKKESISNLASRVVGEVRRVGGEHKHRVAILDPVRKFLWNNLKPVYAMEHIGSATLTEVFNGVRAGEDTWAKDVTEARAYYLDKARKYGYDGWDFKKKYRFTSDSGIEFELTLEQILSLYAYSKRDQAHDHLRLGGFVFDSNIETYKEKGKLKYKVNTADAHQITAEILGDIIGKLSDQQKGFVDEMQEYLSTTMGAKGNEVTMAMYGVKLFKEKFYFPLKSAKQFMFEQNEVSGEVRIKNSGFTNKTVAKANNPVILSNFMDVWAGHVNDMSMYHAFVLPLEDFNRVFNYNSPKREGQPPVSVKGTIQSAYGPAAVSYVKNLITDLNGGARTDSTTGIINKMMGLFKKGSVFASLSVVVQQPSAIARAAALVDTKYFIGPKVDHKRHKALWDEVKQYAPVAIIKEMGYFDTNMGKSTQDFIMGREYSGFKDKMKALVADSGYRDEILSKAPALADEMAWCSIWEAVKREMHDKHKGLDAKSEPFLMLCGSRFTEVVTKTQVYDSVLSRSANMRSKDTGMKMATAFMAEPTTSINMIADALLKGKRGNRKYARAAIGAVIASQIFNSILVSFVYAGRDDDEDKTYAEKYIGTLSGEILDSLNPAGYIPFVKDIMSIVQGYDVERSDMAVVSDLWNAWQKLGSENLSTYRKVEGFAGSIAQIFGLPVKNIMRDARGIYQTVDSFMGGQQTTKSGIGYAVKSAVPEWLGGGDVKNQQQLYEAILNGDQEHLARVKARYKDEDAVSTAIRKALRENDPRIREAAEAQMKGDPSERVRIAKLIIADGFSQDDVVRAINAEINALTADPESSSVKKEKGFYTAEDFAKEIANGDQAAANAAKTDIIRTAEKNGKTAEEAEKSFNSSAKSELKELFLDGKISEEKTISALVSYCGVDEASAVADVQYWAFKQDYPDVYADDSWFDKYYEEVADSGLGIDQYMAYRNQVKDITGEGKKERRMAVIDSLPITDAQKDALYYAEGWAASKLYEAPWH